MRKLFGLSVLAVLVASSVQAAPMLRISSGGSSIEATDGGVGDLGALVGDVAISGSVGVWDINMTMGFTKPILGAADHPVLDVVSFNMSRSAGTLTIEFTDTDFLAPSLPALLSSIGGTTDGTVQYQVYLGLQNQAFGKDLLLTDTGIVSASTGTAFAASKQVPFAPSSDPYSLTQVITITHKARGQTSFDAEIRPVPEPATLGLLGLGGLGLLAVRRRRQQRS